MIVDDIKYQSAQPGKRNLVFQNETELESWIVENNSNLVRGQMLFVKDTDKSFWWNGSEAKAISSSESSSASGSYYTASQVDAALNHCEKIANKGEPNGYAPLNEYGQIPSTFITIDPEGITGEINLDGYEQIAKKGIANGYCGLDANIKILPANLNLTSIKPTVDGTSSAGTSTEIARADHIHPTDTSRAADTAVVKLTGTQTIAGLKTFSSAITCSATPVNTSHLTNKQYVDNLMNPTPTLYGSYESSTAYHHINNGKVWIYQMGKMAYLVGTARIKNDNSTAGYQVDFITIGTTLPGMEPLQNEAVINGIVRDGSASPKGYPLTGRLYHENYYWKIKLFMPVCKKDDYVTVCASWMIA